MKRSRAEKSLDSAGETRSAGRWGGGPMRSASFVLLGALVLLISVDVGIALTAFVLFGSLFDFPEEIRLRFWLRTFEISLAAVALTGIARSPARPSLTTRIGIGALAAAKLWDLVGGEAVLRPPGFGVPATALFGAGVSTLFVVAAAIWLVVGMRPSSESRPPQS